MHCLAALNAAREEVERMDKLIRLEIKEIQEEALAAAAQHNQGA